MWQKFAEHGIFAVKVAAVVVAVHGVAKGARWAYDKVRNALADEGEGEAKPGESPAA